MLLAVIFTAAPAFLLYRVAALHFASAFISTNLLGAPRKKFTGVIFWTGAAMYWR